MLTLCVPRAHLCAHVILTCYATGTFMCPLTSQYKRPRMTTRAALTGRRRYAANLLQNQAPPAVSNGSRQIRPQMQHPHCRHSPRRTVPFYLLMLKPHLFNFFSLFFHDSVLDLLAEETNLLVGYNSTH